MNLSYELTLKSQGHDLIAGLDEAGRGPLAGPVVAAAVIFNFTEIPEDLKGLADSKKLSAQRRENFSKIIMARATAFGVGICDHQTIDRINILQATFLAMKKALTALDASPGIIVIDGNLPLPNYSQPQKSVVNGDEKIFSIAAASVLAKVARDRIMLAMHERYQQYGFKQHKGYGTKLHLKMLEKFGPCEIHRQSFRPVKDFFKITNYQ